MRKYLKIISLAVVLVFVFTSFAGTVVFADKCSEVKGMSKEAGDTDRLRDGTGVNCISNPDCDETPDRDRLQLRDRISRDITITCDTDCDGIPDRDRLKLRTHWDEVEIPEEVLTILNDELSLIKQIKAKLSNEVKNKNKNATDELIKQLEKEMLRFKEMLKQIIEDEELNEDLEEWLRERVLNREFNRFRFRRNFVELPEI